MRLIDADKLREFVISKGSNPLCKWDTEGVLMAIHLQETVCEVKTDKMRTNCDMIRGCSIKWLAMFLSEVSKNGCLLEVGKNKFREISSVDDWMEWLEREVEDDRD